MRIVSTIGIAGFAVAGLATAGCGAGKLGGPTRESVTALLQQEANSLKAEGEKLDPVLRVRATWTVEGLDVTERPKDTDRPWNGKIRFKITSETKDTDGKVVTDEFRRQFDYIYTMSVNRWIFQMPDQR
jgi:hypothetical protein